MQWHTVRCIINFSTGDNVIITALHSSLASSFHPYSSGLGKASEGMWDCYQTITVYWDQRTFCQNVSLIGNSLCESACCFENIFHLKSDKFLIPDGTLFLQYNRSRNCSKILRVELNDKVKPPKLENSSNTVLGKSKNISQPKVFEKPENLPVWSQPDIAWKPSKALQTLGDKFS